ncbi:hypothetical protein [Burkholderia ubonensis]|uniref:hypothetical protein n=1 Tax=Burkholderia ubonensis TaxID=101571 RepID=UPI000751DA10|nr:hypothetical protein [Burkholderia ubonensis]KVP17417.1 hypothetical protein WJ84_04070 [Burkholderia ubonensis]
MPDALLQEGQLAPVLPAKAERPFGLHPEACYLLDCAVEMGDLTPLEDLVFRVKNPAAIAFMELTDRDEKLPPHWLRNTARQFLDSLPLEDRYVWALRGLPGMEFGMRMFQERVEFVVQSKVQSDLGIEERTSIRFLDEATPDMFNDKLFESVHDVTQARVEAFVDSQYSDAKTRLEEDVRFAQQALQWVSQSGNRERARAIAARLFQDVPHLESDTVTGAVTARHLAAAGIAEKRKTQRRARSAIKKALKLFSRTGLEDSVRMMVSGKEVELSHPNSPFKFVLQPLQAGWLEQKTVAPGGHVPYQLTLLTKEGVFLSRLCVLFDQTPVLDQLLALTFFVQSGNEEDILSKANWFGYESATAVRDILQEKAPALLNKVPEPKQGRGDCGLLGGLDTLWRTEAHWVPYKGPVKNWIATWMGELFASIPNPGQAQPVLA